MITQLINYHSYTAAIIGIPASLIPLYVWVRFARTPKGRR